MLDFSASLKPDRSTSDKVGIRVKSLAIFLISQQHSRARPRKMFATDRHRIMDEQRGDYGGDHRVYVH